MANEIARRMAWATIRPNRTWTRYALRTKRTGTSTSTNLTAPREHACPGPALVQRAARRRLNQRWRSSRDSCVPRQQSWRGSPHCIIWSSARMVCSRHRHCHSGRGYCLLGPVVARQRGGARPAARQMAVRRDNRPVPCWGSLLRTRLLEDLRCHGRRRIEGDDRYGRRLTEESAPGITEAAGTKGHHCTASSAASGSARPGQAAG
jgi:hypothetical protein